jgi:hypothetical protein
MSDVIRGEVDLNKATGLSKTHRLVCRAGCPIVLIDVEGNDSMRAEQPLAALVCQLLCYSTVSVQWVSYESTYESGLLH